MAAHSTKVGEKQLGAFRLSPHFVVCNEIVHNLPASRSYKIGVNILTEPKSTAEHGLGEDATCKGYSKYIVSLRIAALLVKCKIHRKEGVASNNPGVANFSPVKFNFGKREEHCIETAPSFSPPAAIC